LTPVFGGGVDEKMKCEEREPNGGLGVVSGRRNKGANSSMMHFDENAPTLLSLFCSKFAQ